MESDPLLKYFYILRSVILKEGLLEYSRTISIPHLNPADLFNRLPPPPPGARAFFVGDQNGGNGWEIELSDGRIEKFYVELPADIGVIQKLHFPNPPTTHLNRKLDDTSIENLSSLYTTYLEGLIREAREEFLNS